MHETVFAENIIIQAKKYGSVESISVEVGELAHVPPPELLECLKRLVNWNIKWEEIPAQAQCKCGFFGHPTVLERGHDHFMIECPKCTGIPKLVSGTEIKLVNVEVREDN